MPIAGVNLGNWLVLEKWMNPGLFARTTAEDEYHLWREPSPDDAFAPTLREAASRGPVMVGEWCLDTASEKPAELGEDDRRRYYRAISKAQLRAWAPAVAWCYWSFKLNTEEPKLEPRDMDRAIEARWLPEGLAAPGD